MSEAYICDFVRTPIGRYGGALRDVRTDDLAAHPLRVLKARHAGLDWEAVDDCMHGLRQPGRRGQPQRRAHGAAARRPAADDSRRHHQPAVRLGSGRRRQRRARDPRRRGRTGDRRRRGEHDARALRDGQGDRSLLPPGGDLRHHDRLALRQSADEGAVRHRFDAGDRPRTSPRNSRSPAPIRMRSRCARSSARRPRAAQRLLRARDRAGRRAGPQGQRHRRR